jgi:hypothetical protein
LEGCYEYNKPVFTCFVDLEKAYDRVPRQKLWDTLVEYGINGPLLQAVESFYRQSQSSVRLLGNKSTPFTVGVGLRQGCVLSPLLFTIFMDRISRRSESEENVQYGRVGLSTLLFADDVVLLAASEADLQHALDRFAAECEEAGMKVSTKKTEAMVVSRGNARCSVRVNNVSLNKVEEFKYLGTTFTGDGKLDREIDRRICAAAAVRQALYGSVVVKRELSHHTKLAVYKAIYVPILTYGHERWAMTERLRSRLQAAEMSFVRRAAGFTLWDRVRSSSIREMLDVEQLLLRIERSQLR